MILSELSEDRRIASIISTWYSSLHLYHLPRTEHAAAAAAVTMTMTTTKHHNWFIITILLLIINKPQLPRRCGEQYIMSPEIVYCDNDDALHPNLQVIILTTIRCQRDITALSRSQLSKYLIVCSAWSQAPPHPNLSYPAWDASSYEALRLLIVSPQRSQIQRGTLPVGEKERPEEVRVQNLGGEVVGEEVFMIWISLRLCALDVLII